MSPAAASPLLDALRASRLLSSQQLSALEQAVARGQTAECLSRLVEQKALTEWQTRELLAGRESLFLGKYLLLDLIGEGGMGAVFRARHSHTRREVALKCMAPALVSNADAVARFLREVRAASAVSHRNIVTAYDAGQEDEFYFLVMEYVPGKDLWTWLQDRERLPVDWACECIRQAADGLQHAHERGLVHRDIKPSNLLVLGDLSGAPQVKLLDLGLARFMTGGARNERLTQTHEIMGTPDYMAPEQATNSKSVDIRSDIYSLGCTLFTLLAGREPFDGDNSIEKLVARSLHDAPPVTKFRPDTPAALVAVIAKMLQRSPDDRYQTPAEVSQALAPFAMSGLAETETVAGDTMAPRAMPTPTLAPARAEKRRSSEPSPSDFRFGQSGPTVNSETPPAPSLESPSVLLHGPLVAVAGAVTGLVVLALLAFLLWPAARPDPVLVLNLDADERSDAKVELDGRAIAIATSGPIEIHTRPGARKLALRRRGYLPYTRELNLAPGDRLEVAPEWVSIIQRTPDGPDPTKAPEKGPATRPQPPKVGNPPVILPGTFDVAKKFPTAPASFHGVMHDLIRRNPGWDPTRLNITMVDGHVDEFIIRGENLVDVAPVAALSRLTFFDATGTALPDIRPLAQLPLVRLAVVGTKVSDLSPIAGKGTLEVLWCRESRVTDLGPLKTLPRLRNLTVSRTGVSSVEPLRGSKLRNLDLSESQVTDLSPLTGLPIEYLNLAGTSVRDLTPVGTFVNLKHVVIEVDRATSLEPLRGLKQLEKINDRAPAQFWAERK